MIKPKFILFIIISVIIGDAFSYISIGGTINIGNSTYITAFLYYISIFILFFIASKSNWDEDVPGLIKNLFKLWILVLILNLIRSCFLASSYWDWKLLFLQAFFFSLIPLAFFLGENLDVASVVFKFVFKYLFTFGFLLIPLGLVTNPELFSRIMIPISLFILFLPYVKFKWKLLILIITFTSILLVPGFRSNIVKSAVSILLLSSFYIKKHIWESWLKWAHFFLFALPIVLLVMAIHFNYNVFEEMDKQEGASVADENGEQSLTQDTRTFLYVEVFSSMDYTYEWVFGKSSIGSYRSDWFYDDGGAIKGKRYGSEVGMLNILLKYGLVGLLIYFLLLFFVSWHAIKNSSNFLAKMIGLFIAFRFTYSFVEEYTDYDLNFCFFWIAIGLVSSTKFRNMTDEEIKTFFKLE